MGEQVTAGRVLSRRRSALRLSQVDLANLTGVSRGTLRNIEGDLVTPNDRTWEALARILAWAPGGLDMINKAGKPPKEVLPAKPLATILAAIIEEDRGDDFGMAAGNFGNLIASADYDGGLSDDKRNELTDFILGLPIAEDEMQQSLDGIDRFLANQGKPTLRTDVTLDEGDRVRHRNYGFGEVSAIERQGNANIAVVDFGDPVGVKRLIVQHAPIERIEASNEMESPTMSGSDISALAERLGLSEEVADLLVNGKVIDYDNFDPSGTENLTVLTLVLKKTNAPLGRQDRRYIGSMWDRLANLLGGNEEPEAPKSKRSGGQSKAPSSPASDPWATPRNGDPFATPAKPSGGLADEPPF